VVFRADPGQHVRIDVFDVAGRRVARLIDATAGAEPMVMTWDGRTADARRAAAGTYYLRLNVGSRSATRTVVLLRQ
jgi:flagellar hook assembly protein FlgD